jgi:hypothetical protein
MKTEPVINPSEQTRLAQQAFAEFYAQCFWYMRKDLKVGPSDIPEIIRGLRHYGGRRGLQLAGRLCR